jgi:preprotein translocase SecE subunit
MVDKPTSKNKKRKLVTVRERAETASKARPKTRRIRRTVRIISTPLIILARMIKKILRPFRFLLWPFKTRPARFIGRILGKIFLINYVRASWQEVKLVTWPDRQETRQLTFAVIVFAFVFGLLITVIDFGLDKIFKRIIL